MSHADDPLTTSPIPHGPLARRGAPYLAVIAAVVAPVLTLTVILGLLAGFFSCSGNADVPPPPHLQGRPDLPGPK